MNHTRATVDFGQRELPNTIDLPQVSAEPSPPRTEVQNFDLTSFQPMPFLIRYGNLVIAFAAPASRQENTMRTVQIDAVVKGASGIICILCIASLILSSISGFDMLNPLIALLMLVASTSFLVITKIKPAARI